MTQIKGIEEAIRGLNQFHRRARTTARNIQRSIAVEMFNGIINRTPVDKGFALASWRMNTGSKLGSTAPAGDFKLRSSKGEIAYDAARSKALQTAREQLGNIKSRPGSSRIPPIFITNNVPYIGRLEGTEGGPTSQQAPAGMVIVTKTALIEKFRAMGTK